MGNIKKSQVEIEKIFIFFVYGCVYVAVCTPHACSCAATRKGHLIPWNWSYRELRASIERWEQTGPLQE